MNPSKPATDAARTKITPLTKVTALGLVANAVAIWIQWLSGDPAYPKVPPGPFIFVLIAAVVWWAARWWWTPLVGALVSLLVTAGWFSRLGQETQRLAHPASIGGLALGIFAGTLLQIVALVVTDAAGLAATVENYRRRRDKDLPRTLCQVLGVLFVLIGLMMLMMRGAMVNRYHNLLHLTWGAVALAIGFAGSAAVARIYAIASGGFYLVLGALGMLLGDASMNEAWHAGPMLLHTADHVFHLALGTGLLATGLLAGQRFRHAAALPSE